MKNKQKQTKQQHPLHAPVGRVGTTKIKDTTVFAEDMYITVQTIFMIMLSSRSLK